MGLIKKFTMVKGYMLFVFVWALLFSFLVPPWQTPDEYVHLTNLGAGIENPDLAGIIADELQLDEGRIMGKYEEKLDKDQWKQYLTKAPEYSVSQCLPRGLDLVVIKYLPATIGMQLGILLHLPVFWVMQLGELFSLLFYVFVSGLALKLMPIRINVFMLIMMFPMVMQQVSGIGHDAMVLPLTFLFTAYIFNLRYERENIGWKQIGAVFGLWLLITYVKIPYVFFAGLVLLLPAQKINLKIGNFVIDRTFIRRWRYPAIAAVFILGAAGMYLGRNNIFIQVVYGMVLEWKRAIGLFLNTLYTWHSHLMISAVGNFGWLDAPVSKIFAVFIALFAIVSSLVCYETYIGKSKRRRECLEMSGYDRAVIWGTFLMLASFTVMSMVNHTIMVMLFGSEQAAETYQIREALYKIPYIGGLQGRYFVPFLPLLFIPLPQLKNVDKKKIYIAMGIVIAFSAVYTVSIIWNRYWI